MQLQWIKNSSCCWQYWNNLKFVYSWKKHVMMRRMFCFLYTYVVQILHHSLVAQLSLIFCYRLKEDFVVVHCSFLFGWVFIKDLPAWLVWELQVRCVGPLGVPSSSYIIVRIIFEDVSLRGAEPASFFYRQLLQHTVHYSSLDDDSANFCVKVCCSSCFQALVAYF